MKNGHSWRLRTVRRTREEFFQNYTGNEICACVYQIIICRFYGVFQHVRLHPRCTNRGQMIFPKGSQVTASFLDELPFGITLLSFLQPFPLESDR
jgi:hypothetical protein